MREWLEQRWDMVGLVGAFVAGVTLSLLVVFAFGVWQRVGVTGGDSVVGGAVERGEVLPPFDG